MCPLDGMREFYIKITEFRGILSNTGPAQHINKVCALCSTAQKERGTAWHIKEKMLYSTSRKEGVQYSMKRQKSSTDQKGSVCSKNNAQKGTYSTGRCAANPEGEVSTEKHNGVSIVQYSVDVTHLQRKCVIPTA